MRLNGISAEPGTIIGVDFRSKRLLTMVGEDDGGMVIRYSTAEEVTPDNFQRVPRSVTEHRAIPRRMSAYGLIRPFKPQPYMRAWWPDDELVGRNTGKPIGLIQ